MRTVKCKYCDSRFQDVNQIIEHLEQKHPEMIPKNMSAGQFYYYIRTGKKTGSCVICHKPTEWNPKTNKYRRFCNNPKCKEEYVKTFQNRMIGKYGKITLLTDPEQQKKMLANRRISGEYVWSDKIHKTTYTGTYELSFLEFLDEIMDFDPEDIIAPSPHNYIYIYNNEQHFYFPDFFIPSLNLEIEIKDGGENANTHPKIVAVDKVKEKLKDEVMISNSRNFNYLKIVDKNNKIFFDYLMKAKENFMNGQDKPIVMM